MRVTNLIVVCCFTAIGCTPEYQEVGDYRIAVVKGGFAGFGCQPRTEFYLLNRSSPNSEPVYLGTCGTPQFVTEHLHMLGDPSCFAVSEDASSLVYFHRPSWCGAGGKAKQKPGGVHLHSIEEGDRLLYLDQRQVSQLWLSDPIERYAIRVTWISSIPSRSGAICPQTLVINADGGEQPEGNPGTPNSQCKDWREPTDARERGESGSGGATATPMM